MVAMRYGTAGDSGAQGESGGGTPTAVLLWTNDSPTTSRDAFDVALNLSAYQGVIILCRARTDNENTDYNYTPKDGAEHHIFAHASSTRANGRRLTVSDSGISFTRGFVGTSGNNDNNAGIPLQIWGAPLTGIQ